MGFVADIVEDVVGGVGDVVGDIVEPVMDVVNDAADSVMSEVVEPVVNAVDRTITAAMEDPIGTVATVGTAIVAPHLLPVVNGVKTIAKGGDLNDALESAGKTYIAQNIGSTVASNVGGEYGQTAGQVAGQTAAGIARGMDPLSALTYGGISAGTSAITANIEGFDELSRFQKQAVNNIVATTLAGGDWSQSLVDTALRNGIAEARNQYQNSTKLAEAENEAKQFYNAQVGRDPTEEEVAQYLRNAGVLTAGPMDINVSGKPIFAESEEAKGYRPPPGYELMSSEDARPKWNEEAGTYYDQNTGAFYDPTTNAWLKPTPGAYSDLENQLKQLESRGLSREYGDLLSENYYNYLNTQFNASPSQDFGRIEVTDTKEPTTDFGRIEVTDTKEPTTDLGVIEVVDTKEEPVDEGAVVTPSTPSAPSKPSTPAKPATPVVPVVPPKITTPTSTTVLQQNTPAVTTAPISPPLEHQVGKPTGSTSYAGLLTPFLKQVEENVTNQDNEQQSGEGERLMMPTYFNYGSEDPIDDILAGTSQQVNPNESQKPEVSNYAQGGLTMGGGTRHGRYAVGGMAAPLLMNAGGKTRVDFRHGDAVTGPGDGQSDDIPAMLADGEFVFPADVVAAIGNGSTKAGSDALYDMMHSIRAHVRSAKPKDLPPEIKSPLDFLKSKPKKRG